MGLYKGAIASVNLIIATSLAFSLNVNATPSVAVAGPQSEMLNFARALLMASANHWQVRSARRKE